MPFIKIKGGRSRPKRLHRRSPDKKWERIGNRVLERASCLPEVAISTSWSLGGVRRKSAQYIHESLGKGEEDRLERRWPSGGCGRCSK